jgi:hypothetical protein
MTTKYVKNPATLLVDSGLLFEINRVFLHPIGLALSVEVPDAPEDQGETMEVRIWDCREDPEGIYFEAGTFWEGAMKWAAFLRLPDNLTRIATRLASLGFVTQKAPTLAGAQSENPPVKGAEVWHVKPNPPTTPV